MSISEALKKQAMAIKENCNKLAEADRLEKRAKLLRAEANKPVKLDLKAIRKAKEERLQGYANAISQNQTEKKLSGAGWQKKDGKWINNERPDFSIEIKEQDFIVYYRGNIYKDKTPLIQLGQFLNRPLAVTQKP